MFLTKKLAVYILLFFSFTLFFLYFIYNFFHTPEGQEQTQYKVSLPNKEIEKDVHITEIGTFFPIKEIETDVCIGETEQSLIVDSKNVGADSADLNIQQLHSDMLLNGEQNAYDQYGGVEEEIIIISSEVDSAEDFNGVIDRELDNGSEIKKMDAPDDQLNVFRQEVNKSGLVEEESVVEKNESYSVKQAEEKDKEPEVGETEVEVEEETSTISKTTLGIIGGAITGVLTIIKKCFGQKIRERFFPERKKYIDLDEIYLPNQEDESALFNIDDINDHIGLLEKSTIGGMTRRDILKLRRGQTLEQLNKNLNEKENQQRSIKSEERSMQTVESLKQVENRKRLSKQERSIRATSTYLEKLRTNNFSSLRIVCLSGVDTGIYKLILCYRPESNVKEIYLHFDLYGLVELHQIFMSFFENAPHFIMGENDSMSFSFYELDSKKILGALIDIFVLKQIKTKKEHEKYAHLLQKILDVLNTRLSDR